MTIVYTILIWTFTLLTGFFSGFVYKSRGRFFVGQWKIIILVSLLVIILTLSILVFINSNWAQGLLVLFLSIFIANPLGQFFLDNIDYKLYDENIKRRFGVSSSDKAIIKALREPLVEEIALEYSLNAADFRDLYDAVKRMGFENKDAEKAIKDKRAIAWYFNTIGTGGKFDIEKRFEFTLLIKNCIE